MLMRVCNDVTLGLTTAHWFWPCMNELMVPAQKGLTQWDLLVPGPPYVHTAPPLKSTLEFWYMKGYFGVQNMVKYWTG